MFTDKTMYSRRAPPLKNRVIAMSNFFVDFNTESGVIQLVPRRGSSAQYPSQSKECASKVFSFKAPSDAGGDALEVWAKELQAHGDWIARDLDADDSSSEV